MKVTLPTDQLATRDDDLAWAKPYVEAARASVAREFGWRYDRNRRAV